MSGRPRSERRLRGQRGQSTLEYLGALAVVAAVIAVVLSLPFGGMLMGPVRCAVAHVFQQTGTCRPTQAASSNSMRVAQLASAPTADSVLRRPRGAGGRPAANGNPGGGRGPNGGATNTGPPNAERGAQWKRLPRSGQRPFVPRSKGGWPPPRVTRGNRGNEVSGYEDKYKNVWTWDPEEGHWDVQTRINGEWWHTRVDTNGQVIDDGPDYMRGPKNPTPPRAPSGRGGSGDGEGQGGGASGGAGDGGAGGGGQPLMGPGGGEDTE